MNLRPISATGDWAEIYARAHATLLERIEKHRIDFDVHYPYDDICVVSRMPTAEQEKVSPGGIIYPDIAQTAAMPFSIGVLLYAGMDALDKLTTMGILPGDYVKFARYAGDEEAVARVRDSVRTDEKKRTPPEKAAANAIATRDAEIAKQKVLDLQVLEIHGSLDLAERLYGSTPSMEIVREQRAQGPIHVVRPISRKD